jgi:hypothetical protein
VQHACGRAASTSTNLFNVSKGNQMSAETDVALMMELEGKIDQRIKDTMYQIMTGSKPLAPADNNLVISNMTYAVRSHLLNDNYFILELAKRIGQKMTNIQY